MKDIVVLYHASCSDGFGSAYAAWKRLGDEAEYIPVQYGQDPPLKEPYPQRLYILDFSYPRPVLSTLRDYISHVTVLDHHKTAREELEDLGKPANPRHVDVALEKESRGLFVAFNEEESGATLSWAYFFPMTRVPDLLRYVRDRDLWLWEQIKSREINAAIRSYPYVFTAWSELRSRIEEEFGAIVEQGAAILRVEQKIVESICKNAWFSEIAEYRVPTVNTCNYQSEVGEALCFRNAEAPFSASYMDISPTERVFSLRSRGDFDVSTIAKKMGGGGHKNAAGFKRNIT